MVSATSTQGIYFSGWTDIKNNVRYLKKDKWYDIGYLTWLYVLQFILWCGIGILPLPHFFISAIQKMDKRTNNFGEPIQNI